MSNNSSDHESDAGDRTDSPARGNRSSYQFPSSNPANIASNAPMGNTATARKPAKRPKTASRDQPAGRSPIIPEGMHASRQSRTSSILTCTDDFADVQAAPSGAENIDERPDGGYINPANIKPKGHKMKWTHERDRQLLVYGLGRDITGKEFQAIADSFPEKPTAKAIQERLTKLRAETRKVLKASGIYDADAVREKQQQEQAAARAQSERQAEETPTQRTLPVKKSRKTAASASSASPAFPPPSQPPLHQPMAPQPPVAAPTSPMAQPELASLHHPALGPPGATAFHTPHSTYGMPTYPYPSAGLPSYMAPPAYPSFQPTPGAFLPSQQGSSLYPTAPAPDLGLLPGSQQYGSPYTMPPTFAPGAHPAPLAPPYPLSAPTGGAMDVPHIVTSQPELESEELTPRQRAQRDLA